MTKLLILLHTISACIWVGGHLILAITILPKSLKERNPKYIEDFESKYEKIGIPALLIQVITGFMMFINYGLNYTDIFSFDSHFSRMLSYKIILLLLTILLAAHARIFIIPKLSESNLNSLAIHIIIVTILSLFFVYFGVSVRFA